jgi:VanZ family protein
MIAISSIPHLTVPGHIRHLDKLAHFIEFAVFGYLLARTMAFQRMRLGGSRILLILLAGVLLAVFDESLQSLVPGRSRNASDWGADIAGIIAALFLWHAIAWMRGLRQARGG